ncbi:MAG TPA: DUF2975 domain-containing protein [Xanthobacteraceae bacterium]|jgi:hypothetical protein|nr:DUF2975 domain-containing protein [Xanthobacteraceae bacterium]
MPDNRRLFAVTQWVLRAGIIVTMLLIGMYVLGLAAMGLGLMTSRLPLDRIAHWTGVTMTADEIGRMALAAFAGAIAALALIHFILRALRRVVASASVGDPFIDANAAELVRVAWLLLGVEVIAALIKPMVYLLAPEAVRARMHDIVHISVTGLFAVLLIFVLAQVFRRGSDMRAELAGTI